MFFAFLFHIDTTLIISFGFVMFFLNTGELKSQNSKKSTGRIELSRALGQIFCLLHLFFSSHSIAIIKGEEEDIFINSKRSSGVCNTEISKQY